MQYKGITLDKFQEDAIKAIESNKSVVVSAPTGSGKTLIADYIIERDLKKGLKVIYTAPIKALSNQKYKEFCKDYGENNIGLLTGDTAKNPRAPILIMTTEIYRNMTMTNDPIINEISYIIFDEIHYITDVERGHVWEESIIFTKPHVRMLCLSATIPNAEEFANWIGAIKEHPVVVIRHDVRPVPLEVKFYDTELGITTLKNIKDVIDIPDYKYVRGMSKQRRPQIPPPSHIKLIEEIQEKTPCLFFSFSRAGCQQKAMQLANTKLFPNNQEITSYVIKKLSTCTPEINKLASTKTLRHCLAQGIAFHHAGLLPIMKEIVEELFSRGLIKVLYTTETFAVGINMPAKTVCFESLRKYDGQNFRLLDSKEFFQIAGRAGRRGIDKEGFVYAMINRHEFEYNRIKELTSRDITPITSQFKLSVNTILNMIKRYTHPEIDEILTKSLHSYQKYGADFDKKRGHKGHLTFEKTVKKLQKMDYLEGNTLTLKGEFLTNIYSDEILIGEIFATPLKQKLTTYQIMIVLACICYEGRRTEFKKHYPSEDIFKLKQILKQTPYVKDEPRFNHIDDLTALMAPVFKGATLFQLLDNTDLLEGDIVRYFRQIIDKTSQIFQATNDRDLQNKLDHIKDRIVNSLKEIDTL